MPAHPDDTGPGPLQWFLAELDRRPGCTATKEMVLELLRSMIGQRLRITSRDLVQPDRLRAVRKLLDSGMDRAQIVHRCAALFDITPRHASSLVTQALTERAEQAIHRRHEARSHDDSPTGRKPPTTA
jgi:hypothetical protein